MRNYTLLDLFCGRFGWSRAFAKRGWKCIGVDLTKPPEIPDGCDFIQADVLNLWVESEIVHIPLGEGRALPQRFDAIVASSPCEEFSVHGMKHFHPHPKYPANGIRLFEHTRALCEASGLPYVMENVRAAQQFVGTATCNAGPFYLWHNFGNWPLRFGVPFKIPQNISKNMSQARDRDKNGKRIYAAAADRMWSTKRKQVVAQIPPELANTVAEYMERLIELMDSRGVQAGYASLSEEQQNTPPHENHSQYSGNPGNGPVIDLAGGASRFTTTSRSHAEPRGLY